MLSYVFMKLLEARPRSYDQRMNEVSGGRVLAMKQAAAAELADCTDVLEIGCGTAELAALLCTRGATVEGFDRSSAMVEVARERIAREGLSERLSVREMGIERMDELTDEAYGAVVATLVLSELTDDERRFALKHAIRALRPGGRLVLVDEVVPRTRARRLLQALVRAPLVAGTYLASGSITRPIPDLVGDVAAAGFAVDKEERSGGDAIAVVAAHKPSGGQIP